MNGNGVAGEVRHSVLRCVNMPLCHYATRAKCPFLPCRFLMWMVVRQTRRKAGPGWKISEEPQTELEK